MSRRQSISKDGDESLTATRRIPEELLTRHLQATICHKKDEVDKRFPWTRPGGGSLEVGGGWLPGTGKIEIVRYSGTVMVRAQRRL